MSADRGLITLELEWKTNNLVRLEYHAFPLIGTLSTRQEEIYIPSPPSYISNGSLALISVGECRTWHPKNVTRQHLLLEAAREEINP